jgi:hypothetical protein
MPAGEAGSPCLAIRNKATCQTKQRVRVALAVKGFVGSIRKIAIFCQFLAFLNLVLVFKTCGAVPVCLSHTCT